jgi:hypothetical protein
MSLGFARHMTISQFARELDGLRVYRGEYVGDRLLENLEEAGLLSPRVRVRYPDAVARRFWLERHAGRTLKKNVEPDGVRWETAVELANALYRWSDHTVYGPSAHPLDDPDPRFSPFIQTFAEGSFEPWLDMRVDVSNDLHPELFDAGNVESFYSTWQVLLAAEVADIGVHFRVNLGDEKVRRSAYDAFDQGKRPADRALFSLLPIRIMHDFARHESTLDAVIWFAEETGRALTEIVKDESGRFQLSAIQSERFEDARRQVAAKAGLRHHVDSKALIELCRFLSERWTDWNRDGRPLIAGAYKAVLAEAVVMAQLFGSVSFGEIRDKVGQRGESLQPILDVVWPDWAQEEKDRVRRTLNARMTEPGDNYLSPADIDAFVDFLENRNLEAFFWRLRSFEEHAFRGNEFALQGMRSDLQGMAVAVEHIARALGGTRGQLYEMFKELWHEPQVLALLKHDDVSRYARQAALLQDWPALKAEIEQLRAQGRAGSIVADLVMAHRIRGGVHTTLPEDNQFELERLFVSVMRAVVLTFAQVPRQNTTHSLGDSA